MSYSEYEFGDFRKYYEGGIDAGLVGFAKGFAEGFGPAYREAKAQRQKQEDDLFRLAIEDIQEQDKRRAKANARGATDATAADRIASMFPGIPGVRAYAYNALAAGQTANAVISDLQTGVKENRIRVTAPDGTQTNPFDPPAAPAETTPAAPAPAPEQTSAITPTAPVEAPAVASAVDTEMKEVMPQETPVAEAIAPDWRTPDGSSFTGEEVQVADASGNWFTALGGRMKENRDALINRNVQRRVDEWKRLTGRATDPTTAEGLVQPSRQSRPVSSVDTEVRSGVPSDVAVGTLTLLPKATEDKSAVDLKPLAEISNVNEAIVAATIAEGSDDPEAPQVAETAKGLVTALSSVPKIGELSVPDLNVFINTPQANAGPDYAGLPPEIYANLQNEARNLLDVKQREGLPSLTFETSVNGEGILADVRAGRYGPMEAIPTEYLAQLNDRIAAASQREAMDFGDAFDEGDYDRLAAQKAIEFQNTPGAYEAWENGVGRQLRNLITNVITPTNYSSPEQAATNVYMRNAEASNLSPKQIEEGLVALQRDFNAKGPEEFTAGDLNGLKMYYDGMLRSGDPAKVAEAEAWFKTSLPAIEEYMRSTAEITKASEPAEERLYTIQNDDGSTETVWGRETPDGISLSSSRGTIIPLDKVVGSESQDAVDTRTRETARFPSAVGEAGALTQAAADFAIQAKSLEDVAQNNPEILTLGGRSASIVSTIKTQLSSMLDFGVNLGMGQQPEEDPDQTRSSIMASLNEILDADTSMTDATKSAYRQFFSESTLLIFTAGRAVGQTGQGFSNADYRILKDALTGATSVDDLARALRKFARSNLENATSNAQRVRGLTQVQATLALPGVTPGTEFQTGQEALEARGASDVWEWVNSAPEISQSRPAATAETPGTPTLTPEQRAANDAAIQSYQSGEAIEWTAELDRQYPNRFTVGSIIQKGQ